MTHLEYENLCRDIAAGNNHEVMNEKSRVLGEILSCRSDYFNVKVGEGWQVWSREVCEETGPAITGKYPKGH